MSNIPDLDARLEAALWPDGPRCPRCPDSREFVRVKSRGGRYHRCLSCYVSTTVTAATFMRGLRMPLAKVLAVFEATESATYKTVRELQRAVELSYATTRSLVALWQQNCKTPDGKRVAALFDVPVDTDVDDRLLLHPDHPLHGLL